MEITNELESIRADIRASSTRLNQLGASVRSFLKLVIICLVLLFISTAIEGATVVANLLDTVKNDSVLGLIIQGTYYFSLVVEIFIVVFIIGIRSDIPKKK